MFFAAKKHGAIHHFFAMKHHKMTTIYHPKTRWKSQNPCKNRPFDDKRIFPSKHRKIKPWESAGKMRWTAFKAMI
jgi:hypothetical protein